MINRSRIAAGILGLGGAWLLAVGVATAQTAVFSEGTVVPLSGTPSDALPILVLADVGSPAGPPDGKLDLVTADQTQTVTVVFGNGDGSFGPLTNGGTPLGRIPTALTIADFDGDGASDLLIADTAGNVVFFHNNGDQSFSQVGAAISTVPGVCAGGATPGATCTSDSTCSGGTCVRSPTGAVALAAGDVTKDGKTDAIVVNDAPSGRTMTALVGNGHGAFTVETPVVVGQGGSDRPEQGVLIEDFNSDGHADVAVTNPNANAIVILHGDGTGAFTVSQTVSEGTTLKEPIAIAAGDLNGDGHIDLVVADRAGDDIAVILAKADGTFQAPRFVTSGTASSAPDGIVVLDANRDGKLDVAVSNNFSFDVSVLLGDGTGNFGLPRAFVSEQEPLMLATSDLNGDGIPDLVTVNRDTFSSTAVVLLGQGDGTFPAVEDVIVQPNPGPALAGDVDNDGLPDLIVAQPGSATAPGTVLVRRALATGGFAAPIALQSHGDAALISVGDFNSDGRLDIVAVNKSTSDISMFVGQANGGFTSRPPYPVGDGATAVAVGDWDGNGRPDLAVARQGATAGAVDILLSNADGSLPPLPSTITLSTNPADIAVGDFNKDGKLDLVLANSASSNLSILLGNGNGTFQTAVSVPVPGITGDVRALAIADFDGDGFEDIAAALPKDQEVLVLYGGANLSFMVPPGPPQLRFRGPPGAVAARDLTGDLIPDLVVADQTANAVVPFLSQGASKIFLPGASVTVSRMPSSVVAADFDGDGRYDAAAADNFVAGNVSVATNIEATPILHGDSNGDRKVSAADIVALARKMRDGASTSLEQAGGGNYPVGPGADANGDGVITAQDIRAVAYRLFPRI